MKFPHLQLPKCYKHLANLAVLCLLSSSCLPGGQFFEQKSLDELSSEDVKVELSGEKAVAKVSASATVVQKLTAPAESSISGTELNIPPGTLQIDMSITLEESTALTSSSGAGAMGVSFGSEAGKAINLANDQGILELPATAPPMTLRIPVASAGLRMQDPEDVLVTFMRQALPGGDCIERIYPPSLFTFASQKIQIDVRSFAAYQPIYMPKVELDRALQSSPYDYIEANRPGCRIVTKTEQKTLPQLSLADFSSKLSQRTLILAANFKSDRSDVSLFSCDLYGKDLDTDTLYAQESDEPYFEIDLGQRLPALKGRFAISCLASTDQTVESSFLSVTVAAQEFPLSVTYSSQRQVIFEASLDLDNVASCEGQAKDSNGTILQTLVIESKKKTIDFSQRQDAIKFTFQITCILDNGQSIFSKQVKVDLPAVTSDPVPDENNHNQDGQTSTEVDDSGPVVTALNWLQSSYTPGESATLAMQIDEANELQTICLNLDSINYQPLDLGCLTPTFTGTAYQVAFVVPDFIDNVTYGISKLVLVDGPGNHRSYHGSPPNTYFADSDLANVFFSVTGASPDTVPPTVSSLSISAGNIALPATISLSFLATDANAGVAKNRQHCFIFEGKTSYFNYESCQSLTDLGASSYSVSFDFPAYMPDDDYFLKSFAIFDRAGNATTFSAISTDSVYPSTSEPVSTFTSIGGIADGSAPIATDIYFSDAAYHPGDYAELYVHLADFGGAGISEIIPSCWNLYEGNYGQVIVVCGSLRYLGQDVYIMDFYIPLDKTSGTYFLYDFSIQDHAGNTTYYTHNTAPPTHYSEDTALAAPSFELSTP